MWDLGRERKLYYHVGEYIGFLTKWTCKSNVFFECVQLLSEDLVVAGLWVEADATYVKAWLQDLRNLGYKEPALATVSPKCSGKLTPVIYYPEEQLTTYGESSIYSLPPMFSTKFTNLGKFINKQACPNRGHSNLPMPQKDGSSRIDDILLVIQLDTIKYDKSDCIARLESYYRSKFSQILYCGVSFPWVKTQVHKWRVSFVAVEPKSALQTECLLRAAQMRYLVSGILMIKKTTLLNIDKIKAHKPANLWVTSNWIAEKNDVCTMQPCVGIQLSLEEVSNAFKMPRSDRIEQKVSACPLNRGKTYKYLKDHVFYIPSKYSRYILATDKLGILSEVLLAWLQCLDPTTEILHLESSPNALNISDAIISFPFVDQMFFCQVV